MGALIYTRVSDEEQQKRNVANLPTQEKKCRDDCHREAIPVLKVFTDEESARTTERTNLQRMLDYCRENRGKVSHVIVADLSRLARNVAGQGTLIARLTDMGIALRSVDEPHIDRSAAGKLSANLLGSVNQFYSDVLSERVRYRMAEEAAESVLNLAGTWLKADLARRQELQNVIFPEGLRFSNDLLLFEPGNRTLMQAVNEMLDTLALVGGPARI